MSPDAPTLGRYRPCQEDRMAKLDIDEIGKPGKPPKYRRFPWRLWLFALVMTACAGAGGYYAWQYRQKANSAGDDAQSCGTKLEKAQVEATSAGTKVTECLGSLDTSIKKNKELEGQLTNLSSNLSASKD